MVKSSEFDISKTPFDISNIDQQRIVVPTGVSENGHDQHVVARVSTPAEIMGSSVVRFMAWSSTVDGATKNGRNVDAEVDGFIAAQSGRQVITIDTPGQYDHDGYRMGLTREQTESLKDGQTFRVVGAHVIHAINELLERGVIQEPAELAVQGWSQGAAVAAGLMGQHGDLNSKVSSLIVAEPVNIEERSRFALGKDFALSSTDVGRAQALQPDVLKPNLSPLDDVRRDWRLRKAIWAYATALSGNRFMDDFGDGVEVPAHLAISRAQDSTVCPGLAYDDVVRAISQRRSDVDVSLVEGLVHSYGFTPGYVIHALAA